jgi:hypothetical protein
VRAGTIMRARRVVAVGARPLKLIVRQQRIRLCRVRETAI